MRRKAILSLALLAVWAAPVKAQASAILRVELASKLYALIDQNGAANSAVNQLANVPLIGGETAGTAQAIAEFFARFSLADSMRTRTIRFYSDRFSAEELRSLITFYESDVAQKLLASRTLLQREMMDVTAAVLAKHQDEFAELLRRATEKRRPPL
jgi:hypothetical protein